MNESKNQKINDGWDDVAYDFGLPPEANAEVAALLNAACHVFYHHADGTWATHDKDAYASKLARHLLAFPELRHKLLATNDRVVRMVTFRAIDLLPTIVPP